MQAIYEANIDELDEFQSEWHNLILTQHQSLSAILQRMLMRRFGELPMQLQQLLSQANAAQIEQWADRFIEATTLEAIFGDFNKK